MKKPLFLAALLCGCMMASFAQAAAKAPGFKFANGWTLSPNLSLGAFWESNARDTYRDEDAGGGWRLQPTLQLTHTGRRTRFNTSAFYTLERGFDSDDALDSDSYGISLSLTRELSAHYTLSGSISYSRSENDEFYGEGWDSKNPDLSRIDKDKTENYNAQAALGFQNQRWQWSLGLGWGRTRYLDDHDSETNTYNFSALLGRAIGPRTYWNFSLSTSWDDAEGGGSADNGYYLMTGVSGTASKKLTYSAMVGVGIYDFDGKSGGETEFGPTYNVSLAYKISRRFALSLAMSSQYEPEYSYGGADTHYLWSHHLTGAVNAKWTDKCSSRLNLSWAYEDHIAGGSSKASDYDRTYYQVAFNTTYRVGTHTSLYGTLSWNYDAYDNENKDDFRIDVGVSYAF